jgi:hypothetical protein
LRIVLLKENELEHLFAKLSNTDQSQGIGKESVSMSGSKSEAAGDDSFMKRDSLYTADDADAGAEGERVEDMMRRVSWTRTRWRR